MSLLATTVTLGMAAPVSADQTTVITEPAAVITEPAVVTQPAAVITQPGAVVSQPAVVSVEPVGVPNKGEVKYYNGTRFRYYPNHVVVADTYDQKVIQDIVVLSNELGWDTVYIQVPDDLRAYTNQYFLDKNLKVHYFGVDVNPDDTVEMIYGPNGAFIKK